MTRNQLQYHANLEQARHNRATENENFRSNYAKERETNRSNVAQETETNRSNVARETETNRHNVVSERETERYNKNKNAADYIGASGTLLSGLAKAGETVSKYVPVGTLQYKLPKKI